MGILKTAVDKNKKEREAEVQASPAGLDKVSLQSSPSISAFFPAYNDAGTIASMVLATLVTCRELTDDFEVIVINDGSKDYTAEVLDELAAVYPQVRVIHHQKNRGYGGALRSGFSAASKDLVFYTDGDAQYDPHELKILLERLTPGVDIVNGYKIERHDPLHRIVIGKLYHLAVKFAFRLEVRDTDCDFRLIRRKCFDDIELTSNTGTICLELVKKLQDAGYKFDQVPVHHFHRAYGKSQFFNFPRLWFTGVHLLELWWRLMVRREHKSYHRERIKARQELQAQQNFMNSADSSQD